MANRPVYIALESGPKYIDEVHIDFSWFPGFSSKQKEKSIQSLHQNFLCSNNGYKVLEISSKSQSDLGVALSAFNLMITTKRKNQTFSVESAFQASKVFADGGPFVDLLDKTSREAKKDPRLKNSGTLMYFELFKRRWSLEPKTHFYDWLYINALSKHQNLTQEIIKYNAFTDIEFNPQKSINCQAKSAALYVSLYKRGLLDRALASPEDYLSLLNIKVEVNSGEQISMFE